MPKHTRKYVNNSLSINECEEEDIVGGLKLSTSVNLCLVNQSENSFEVMKSF